MTARSLFAHMSCSVAKYRNVFTLFPTIIFMNEEGVNQSHNAEGELFYKYLRTNFTLLYTYLCIMKQETSYETDQMMRVM